jgi:acetylornithine/N-succinyldiaminopimelate aminotransferase
MATKNPKSKTQKRESAGPTTKAVLDQFQEYVIPNYTRLPMVVVRGEGSRVWDADGREYLDLFPGWGVNLLGHCPPAVVEAVREQAGTLLHMPNNYYTPQQGELAQVLSERSFGGQCFFCNSGAEAVEGAIKLARLHSPTNRRTIVTMHNSFHGRTLAAMTATAQEKYHAGIGPVVPGFRYVPFNDMDALRSAVDDSVCAVMLEPIQGEGGVNIPADGYLAAVRRLCDERGMLFIADEVTTGCGRTGKWCAYQYEDVAPDVMTLAKGLGGGVPIGALVASREVAKSLVPGMHASTFGGNPLVCAAALAACRLIDEQHLLERAVELGGYALRRLQAVADGLKGVKEVRGRGLMLGIELTAPGVDIVNTCRERGVLINCTHVNVLRIYPALTIAREELDRGLSVLGDVLKAWKPE